MKRAETVEVVLVPTAERGRILARIFKMALVAADRYERETTGETEDQALTGVRAANGMGAAGSPAQIVPPAKAPQKPAVSIIAPN